MKIYILSVLVNNSWTVIEEGCLVSKNSDGSMQVYGYESDCNIILNDKNWYNPNINFIVYEFSVSWHKPWIGEWTGLQIYNSESESWCEYYFVAIGRYSMSGRYIYKLKVERHQINGNSVYELAFVTLPFNIIYNQIYTMYIFINSDSSMSLTVYDNLSVNISYVFLMNLEQNGTWQIKQNYSGYVGIWSDEGIYTVARTLYVSGTEQTVKPLNTSDKCKVNIPSTSPTTEPSEMLSTFIPTISTTNYTLESRPLKIIRRNVPLYCGLVSLLCFCTIFTLCIKDKIIFKKLRKKKQKKEDIQHSPIPIIEPMNEYGSVTTEPLIIKKKQKKRKKKKPKRDRLSIIGEGSELSHYSWDTRSKPSKRQSFEIETNVLTEN